MNKGYAIIELLLAGILTLVVILAMSDGLVVFTILQKFLPERAQEKVEVTNRLKIMGHMVRFANRCNASSLNSLTCYVLFDPNSMEVTVTFKLVQEPDNSNNLKTYLVYERGTQQIWKSEIVDFIVCSGNDIINNNCLVNGPTWAGSPISLNMPTGLDNYFRIKLIAKMKNGGSFPVQGGFFNRNSDPLVPRYTYVPINGQ